MKADNPIDQEIHKAFEPDPSMYIGKRKDEEAGGKQMKREIYGNIKHINIACQNDLEH